MSHLQFGKLIGMVLLWVGFAGHEGRAAAPFAASTPTFVEQDLEFEGEADASEPADVGDIPPKEHPLVRKWVSYFSRKARARFQRFLNRGAVYRFQVEKTLAAMKLPKNLYYLALIESGFRVDANSRASAVGIWQFIRATGLRYGLIVGGGVDERRDPWRSTTAAATYLRDLYNVFQSWPLAMAAYNCGESRVMRVIMSRNTRDFWRLAEKQAFPAETSNYVPKFLAAAAIGSDPERYGFTVPKAGRPLKAKMVKVPSSVTLRDVAKVSGVRLKNLVRHNPQLLRKATPRGPAKYGIWASAADVAKIERSEKRLASLTAKRSRPAKRVAQRKKTRPKVRTRR